MICESKIDYFSPIEQFIIEGKSTVYRLNRNDRGRRMMLIAKDNLLSSRLDKYCLPKGIEIVCIEVNL